jgi:hypothetical protein
MESANPLHTKSIVKKNKSMELRVKTSRNNYVLLHQYSRTNLSSPSEVATATTLYKIGKFC